VSAHVRERLSAYLDDEVDREERAAIDTHLAECPACSRWLEDLALVDSAVAGLPLPEPEGDAEFAARVRARIEAEGARPARARGPSKMRALPAWTWAAAAALLVAVVTPLTLREFRSSGDGSELRAVTPTAPADGGGPVARATEPARGSPEPQLAKPVPNRARAESGPQALGYLHDETATPPSAQPRRAGERELDKRAVLPAAAAAPPPAPPPPAQTRREVQAEQPEGTALGVEGGVVGGVVGGTADARNMFATPPQETPPAGQAVAKQERSAENAPRAAGKARRDDEESARLKAGRPATPAASGAAAKTADSGEAEAFGRLALRQPKSAEEWRGLREAWRTLALTHPDRARADEALVRAVEAAAAAYRASGDEKDERVLERDVAEYLERKDAAQGDRVRRVLRQATP
jgi:hypothetical protein